MKAIHELIQDILKAIDSIESYQLKSYDDFIADLKTQDGIMYNLTVMGEAANRIPVEFQNNHPEIPWSSIIGTRNIIVHGYDQVKFLIVWDIIHKNLPDLKKLLIGLAKSQ